MQEPNDAIGDILAKGYDITQDDVDMIEILLCLGDTETAYERRGYVMEAVALIVNDPIYRGDVAPVE